MAPALGERARRGLEAVAQRRGLPISVCGGGSVFRYHLLPERPVTYRQAWVPPLAACIHREISDRLLLQGVMMPSDTSACCSTVMTAADIKHFLQSLDAVLEEMPNVEMRIRQSTRFLEVSSYSSVWINAYLTAKASGMRFLTPRGLAGLGWGFPMAIGAKLVDPKRPVICVARDGGFGHCWSELETAVREKIAVKLIVLNNGTLGYQKDAEHVKFGRHTSACYFGPVNHAAIAEACGCPSRSITAAEDLPSALSWALETDSPVLLDILTDPYAYPPLTMYDGALKTARNSSEATESEIK